MLTHSLSARVALSAALLLSAGCSDGTGPAHANFDPVKTNADLDVLADVQLNPSVQSFFAMSGFYRVTKPATTPRESGRVLSSILALLNSAPSLNLTAQAARHLAPQLFTSGSSVPSLGAIPPDRLGTTYIFDEASDRYTGSTREGAPANGVRFILYAFDSAFFTPIVETETGYVDILDVVGEDFGKFGLRVMVVSEGTTQLEFSYTHTVTVSSVNGEVAGFFNRGSTRLDFDLNETYKYSKSQFLGRSFEFSFSVPARGFNIDGSVHAASSTSREERLSIESGAASVRYGIDVEGSAVEGIIVVNGKFFATVSGAPGAPSVAGVSGEELTNEGKIALTRLLKLENDANRMFSRFLGTVLGITLPFL